MPCQIKNVGKVENNLVTLTEDKERANALLKKIWENEGHCPYSNPVNSTECPCDKFTKLSEGACDCNLFVKIKD